MKIDTVLVLTYEDKGTKKPILPHMKWLRRFNPGLERHVITGADSPLGKYENWKNSDRPLILWWQRNRHAVKGEGIAVFEWDTLAKGKLPEIPNNFDLVGKQLIYENLAIRGKWQPKMQRDPEWNPDNWWWWHETSLLGLAPNQRGVGLVSMGALFMRRWVLDAVASTKWNIHYAKSIISELRFPTIASLCGARIGQIPLPFVEFDEVSFNGQEGVYHSVKEDQELPP